MSLHTGDQESYIFNPVDELSNLLAFGMYKDRNIDLDEASKLKLRLVTVISLAEGRQTIPFNLLCDALELSEDELHLFLIEGILKGAFKGKINSTKKYFRVEWTAKRNLKDSKAQILAEKIDAALNLESEFSYSQKSQDIEMEEVGSRKRSPESLTE